MAFRAVGRADLSDLPRTPEEEPVTLPADLLPSALTECGRDCGCLDKPLTSEPAMAEDVPLTSEPPLTAEPALTSEPTAVPGPAEI